MSEALPCPSVLKHFLCLLLLHRLAQCSRPHLTGRMHKNMSRRNPPTHSLREDEVIFTLKYQHLNAPRDAGQFCRAFKSSFWPWKLVVLAWFCAQWHLDDGWWNLVKVSRFWLVFGIGSCVCGGGGAEQIKKQNRSQNMSEIVGSSQQHDEVSLADKFKKEMFIRLSWKRFHTPRSQQLANKPFESEGVMTLR